MPKSYLRMLVSSPHELPFVWMNALEAGEHVDEVLVCEANRTHTGEPRELIYESLLERIDDSASSRIRYVPMDLSDTAVPFNGSSEVLHYNEQLIRNGFTAHVNLAPEDIVFSVDADEIINRQSYPSLIRLLSRQSLPPSCLYLRMHQFAYKLNYYWKGHNWRAPVACRAGVYLGNPRAQWRYRGWRLPRRVGTHFAWVMTPEEMSQKIMRFSHRVELEHLADPAALKKAVADKVYVFDRDVKFDIVELTDFTPAVQPESLLDIQGKFPELFSARWIQQAAGSDT